MKHLNHIIKMVVLTALLTSNALHAPLMKLNDAAQQANKWSLVQQKAQDTVIQLFVYTGEFNWFEPYKSPKIGNACGSGFFIDDQGHLLTNYHVVEQAVSIQIQIPSQGLERFDVEIIGVAPENDVALLKLTSASYAKVKKSLKRFPFLMLGDSDKVARTQEILSLGYPLGQEKLKSTQGIVSGRERVGRESYIQITAALNEGNSGGPSLNAAGEVIGINTAGFPKAQSVGYILPINDVKNVVKRLYHEKVTRRPFLGIEINYSNEAMHEYLQSPNKEGGVYIRKVFKGTPFDKLGVKEGDILAELNDYHIDFYGETEAPWSEDKVSIVDIVNRFEVGQEIKVGIIRNGKLLKMAGKLGLSEELAIRKKYPAFEEIDYEIIGGLVVMELTLNHVFTLLEKRLMEILGRKPLFAKFMSREEHHAGKLIITRIFPGSAAHRARSVEEGDLVEQVNGIKVATLCDFRRAIQESIKTGFLSIKSDDHELTVLKIKDIIAQEDELAQRYLFKKSPLLEMVTAPTKKRPQANVTNLNSKS